MGALGGFFNKEVPLTPPPAPGGAPTVHGVANGAAPPLSPASGPPPTQPAAQAASPNPNPAYRGNSTPASPSFASQAFAPAPAQAPAPVAVPVSNAPSSSGNYPIVTALYDNEADADDELAFSAGDKVEVLKTEDGGWWFGRANGREGLFPVDYVNVGEMQ